MSFFSKQALTNSLYCSRLSPILINFVFTQNADQVTITATKIADNNIRNKLPQELFRVSRYQKQELFRVLRPLNQELFRVLRHPNQELFRKECSDKKPCLPGISCKFSCRKALPCRPYATCHKVLCPLPYDLMPLAIRPYGKGHKASKAWLCLRQTHREKGIIHAESSGCCHLCFSLTPPHNRLGFSVQNAITCVMYYIWWKFS